jgi:hypothetical protein
MPKPKNVLINMDEILSFSGVKIGAAHVAAHAPLTFRLRSAHVAAYVAAHVRFSEQTESLFATIIHSTAWRQIIVA